jgi:hypothetical protein
VPKTKTRWIPLLDLLASSFLLLCYGGVLIGGGHGFTNVAQIVLRPGPLSSELSMRVCIGWGGILALMVSVLVPGKVLRCIAGGIGILCLTVSLTLIILSCESAMGSLCCSLPFVFAVILRVILLVKAFYPHDSALTDDDES